MAVPCQGERLLACSHGYFESISAGVRGEGLAVASGGHGDCACRFQERDNKDGVGHGVVAIGFADEVVWVGAWAGVFAGVGRVARCGFEGGTVPVDQLVGFDMSVYGRRTGFIGSDVRLCHLEKAVVRHVVGPFTVAVVEMWGIERTDIMTFTVIVPCDYFYELGGEGEDFSPSLEPEKVGWENPVFAVRNL